MTASIYKPETIAAVWQKMSEFWEISYKTGLLLNRRNEQFTTWMWNHVQDEVMAIFRQHPDIVNKVIFILSFEILKKRIKIFVFRPLNLNVIYVWVILLLVLPQKICYGLSLDFRE